MGGNEVYKPRVKHIREELPTVEYIVNWEFYKEYSKLWWEYQEAKQKLRKIPDREEKLKQLLEIEKDFREKTNLLRIRQKDRLDELLSELTREKGASDYEVKLTFDPNGFLRIVYLHVVKQRRTYIVVDFTKPFYEEEQEKEPEGFSP